MGRKLFLPSWNFVVETVLEINGYKLTLGAPLHYTVVLPVSIGHDDAICICIQLQQSLDIRMKWFMEVLYHSPWCTLDNNLLTVPSGQNICFHNHNDSILASHIIYCLRGISITYCMCWTWYFVLDLQLWNKQKC